MTKAMAMAELMKKNAELIVSRERCRIGDTTVSRRIVESLMAEDRLVFSRRLNNFTKAYKLAVS